jgi:hypothetical protein
MQKLTQTEFVSQLIREVEFLEAIQKCYKKHKKGGTELVILKAFLRCRRTCVSKLLKGTELLPSGVSLYEEIEKQLLALVGKVGND